MFSERLSLLALVEAGKQIQPSQGRWAHWWLNASSGRTTNSMLWAPRRVATRPPGPKSEATSWPASRRSPDELLQPRSSALLGVVLASRSSYSETMRVAIVSQA